MFTVNLHQIGILPFLSFHKENALIETILYPPSYTSSTKELSSQQLIIIIIIMSGYHTDSLKQKVILTITSHLN